MKVHREHLIAGLILIQGERAEGQGSQARAGSRSQGRASPGWAEALLFSSPGCKPLLS